MHLATSTGYGIYLIMWLPFLFLVAGVGFQSLHLQIRSGRWAETMWKLQPWTLVATAGVAISIHYLGLTQLLAAYDATDPNSWLDGMKIIRFVDIGYYVILGIGIFLLVFSAVARRSNQRNQKPNKAEMATPRKSSDQF